MMHAADSTIFDKFSCQNVARFHKSFVLKLVERESTQQRLIFRLGNNNPSLAFIEKLTTIFTLLT